MFEIHEATQRNQFLVKGVIRVANFLALGKKRKQNGRSALKPQLEKSEF
jgi:hypothetical protein